MSLPSRSTVEVKLGMFANGEVRKAVFHWSLCKVAYLREDQADASRPALGRPRKPPVSVTSFQPDLNPSHATFFGVPPTAPSTVDSEMNSSVESLPEVDDNPPEAVEPSIPSRPVRTTRNPHPVYT